MQDDENPAKKRRILTVEQTQSVPRTFEQFLEAVERKEDKFLAHPTFQEIVDSFETDDLNKMPLEPYRIISEFIPNLTDFLFLAVQIGDTSLVKRLIAVGVEPNAIDKYKQTPLHYAARYGQTDIARILLAAGAKPGLQNNTTAEVDIPSLYYQRPEPLFLAIQCGNAAIVEMLIAAGAKVETRDLNNGATALLEAVLFLRYEIVEFLLTKHANPNAQKCTGLTSLHYAATQGDERMVQLLIDYHADPFIKDHGVFEDLTPRQDAERYLRCLDCTDQQKQKLGKIIQILEEYEKKFVRNPS
jgi:hypothetical protein